MSILDEIMQMKNQGKNEEEIVSTLREKGITPGQINDAINQSKIKSAVTNEQENPQETMRDENLYAPQPQEEYEGSYEPQQPQADYQPEQAYSPQENYETYSQGTDTDTIMEIAEHVFFEKIKEIQKQVEIMTEFKNLNQAKTENIDERLKRIESTIDKLQGAILEKIGEYGNNLQSIKNEMSMMQDSFGKVMKKQSTPQTTKKKVVKE